MRWPADRDREFTEFVMARRAALVRVAALLVSDDLAKAEDVVQTALTRLYLAWPRVRPDTAHAYARRCVVNAATDDRRSLFGRHEQVRAQLPDIVSAAVEPGDATTILALLAARPAGMRAAVVLRYVEGRCRRPSPPARRERKPSPRMSPAGIVPWPAGAAGSRAQAQASPS